MMNSVICRDIRPGMSFIRHSYEHEIIVYLIISVRENSDIDARYIDFLHVKKRKNGSVITTMMTYMKPLDSRIFITHKLEALHA